MKLSADKSHQRTDVDPNTLHKEAEIVMQQFLTTHGDPQGNPIPPGTVAQLFADKTPESERVRLLLGNDSATKTARRTAIKAALD